MAMMEGTAVWTPDRRRVRLGPLIKSGGAGSVYLLGDTRLQVAKIYHPNAGIAAYSRKVAAMLTLSPKLPEIDESGKRFVQIAWPQAALLDDRGQFVGFLMPALDVAATSELEYILQDKQARQQGLPTGLGPKVTLGANLCAVLAELHRQGHFVVDLKPVNLRFYRTSLYLAMLDCDGFSIQGQGERFPADQVTPDYLAPEYQARGVAPGGEEAQDRFAMAVVIFQLMNFGIHPYTGRPKSDRVPTDVPGRIAGSYYAYGLQTNSLLAPSPVSGHECFPPRLRALFDRAFGTSPAARPAAIEWAQELRGYAQRSRGQLVACAQDSSHQHFAGMPCATCARAGLIRQTAKRQSELRRQAASPLRRVLGWRRLPPAASAKPTATIRRGTIAPPSRGAPYTLPTPVRVPNQVMAPSGFLRIAVIAVWFVFFVFSHYRDFIPASSGGGASPGGDVSTSRRDLSSAERRRADEAMKEWGRLARANEDQSSQPAPLASSRPSVPARACFRGWNRLDDGSGRLAVVVETSARYREGKTVVRGFDSMMIKARGLGAKGSPLPAQIRSQFDAFVATGRYDDRRARDALVSSLEHHLRSHRQTVEAAFERGWMSLSEGDLGAATEGFACGIEIDPRFAPNWYGLGVSSLDDHDAVGFIAVSYLLEPDLARRADMRRQYGTEILRIASRDPEAFAATDHAAAVLAQRLAADGVQLPVWPGRAPGS